MAIDGLTVRVDDAVLRRMIRETPNALDDRIGEIAFEVHGDIVESFGTSPPGRTYSRGGVTHVASQPGIPRTWTRVRCVPV